MVDRSKGFGFGYKQPLPSRLREGLGVGQSNRKRWVRIGANSLPSRLREEPGVGQCRTVPRWTSRNTRRARELRNSATPAERRLWCLLSHSQLGSKFSRQMPVGWYFADFLCRERKLAVEIDGFSHDLRQAHDHARDLWLRRQGYRVLRFSNADVLGDVEGVVTAIRLELERLAHP